MDRVHNSSNKDRSSARRRGGLWGKWGLLSCAFLLVAHCGSAVDPIPPEDTPISSAASTLVFDAEGNHWAITPVLSGERVAIQYDESRLPKCRAYHDGLAGWQITAYVMLLPSEEILVEPLFEHTKNQAGETNFRTWVQRTPEVLIPDGTTHIDLWFENISGFDAPCTDIDNNGGQYYRFAVEKALLGPNISFLKNGKIVKDGSFRPGGEVLISYENERMVSLAKGDGTGLDFLSAKYQCFDFSCCAHYYTITLHARYHGTGSFEEVPVVKDQRNSLQLPEDATRLEIYFSGQIYTETWYCSGDSTGPKTIHDPDWFYDSNSGQNFIFGF